MHVDQRAERALGAGEHPVDWALFISLHVVGVEILGEVFADVLAKCVLDILQVLAEMRLAEGGPQEKAEAIGDVVGEPVAVEHGDDVVGVRLECWGRHLCQIIGQRVACIGEDQAGGVKADAPISPAAIYKDSQKDGKPPLTFSSLTMTAGAGPS